MTIIQVLHGIDRPVFTTREMAGMTRSSIGSTTQSLRRLERQNVIRKIMRGVWALANDRRFNPFLVVPYLSPGHRSYVSFISALHSHGVISQIPQVITVASTAHTRIARTAAGTFGIHQISPDLFCGFDWHKSGGFLVASAEKAFVDCVYLSIRKKNQFANFPEMDMDLLKRKMIKKWVENVKDPRVRKAMIGRIASLGINL